MKTSQRRTTKGLVIGLDCSTTGTKAIAFDRKGNVVARAHEAIPLSSPKPHYYEQDPNDW
jgi:xylulokinase